MLVFITILLAQVNINYLLGGKNNSYHFQCRRNYISIPNYMSRYRRPVNNANRLFSNGRYPIDLHNLDLIQYLTTLQSLRNIKYFQNPHFSNRTRPRLNCREKEIFGNGSVVVDCCLPVQINPHLCKKNCDNTSTPTWVPFSIHCFRKLISKPFSKVTRFLPKKNASIELPETTISPPKMVMYFSESQPHFQKLEETTTAANYFQKPQQVTLMIIFKRSNTSNMVKRTSENFRKNENRTLSTMLMPGWISRLMNQSRTANKSNDIWREFEGETDPFEKRHKIVQRPTSSFTRWIKRRKKATKSEINKPTSDSDYPEELTILYLSQTKRKPKTMDEQNYTENIIEPPIRKIAIKKKEKQRETNFNVESSRSNLTIQLSDNLLITDTTESYMQLINTTTDITTKSITSTQPETTISLDENRQRTTNLQQIEDTFLLTSPNLTLIPPTWKNSRYLSFAKNTSLYCNDFLAKIFKDSQQRLTELSNNLIQYGSTIIIYIPTIFDQFINTVFGNYHIIKHCSLLSPITMLKNEILSPAKDCVKNKTDSGVFFINQIIIDTRMVLNKMNLVCNFEGCQDRPVRCRKLIWLFNEAFVEGATKVSSMFYDALLNTKTTHHDVLMCVTGAIKKLVSNFEMINSEFIKCAEDFFEEYEIY